MVTDAAYLETDKELKRIERELKREYRKAADEVQKRLEEYTSKFKAKDEALLKKVNDGLMSEADYKKWRANQIATGREWAQLRDNLAQDYVNADKIARDAIGEHLPNVYANNFNFATYEIEKDAKINTNFKLYNKDTVNRLVREHPQLLPKPGARLKEKIKSGQAKKYNEKALQSSLIQAIMQGDSIDDFARRISRDVGEQNYKTAVRNARTMVTGAQNAGRFDAMKRAEDLGVKQHKEWLSVHDGRTRDSHRELDYEAQPLDKPFSNGLMKPGDPSGAPSEVYNCRCAMRSVVEGLEPQARKYRDDSVEGMSYEEWKQGHATEKADKVVQMPSKATGSIADLYEENAKNPHSAAYNQFQTRLNSFQSKSKIDYKEVKYLDKQLTDEEIIERLAGGDMTKGSCSSLSYAYIANKNGLDVIDFRGGASQEFFSYAFNESTINRFEGVKTQTLILKKEASDLPKKLAEMNLEKGKEYRLSCGRHAAIIRNTDNGFEYLELQSSQKNGWKSFTKKDVLESVWDENGHRYEIKQVDCKMSETLASRFKCRKTASNRPLTDGNGRLLLDENGLMMFGEKAELTEVDSFMGNSEFKEILGYINTDPTKQRKGVKGGTK